MFRCYSCENYNIMPDENCERSDSLCPDCHAEINQAHAEHERWNSLSFPQKLAENTRSAIMQAANTVKYRRR